MKSLTLCVSLVVVTGALAADEPATPRITDTLSEMVSASQANFEAIDTMTAIYKWHEAVADHPPRDGNVHFVWDQNRNRFRSSFQGDNVASDTISTSSEFVRVSPGQHRTLPAANSRKFWSADVLSPTRLFGIGDRPLWQSLKTYTKWAEANDRIVINASGEDDDLVYAIRMHYIGVGGSKLFVTRTLAKSNAFHPTLIVRSKGTDTATANLIDVTSWTYTTVDGIVIPRSISVSKFDERTGAPTMQRNLYLKSAIVNERLDKSTFDTDEAHSTSLRNPATDSERRSSGRRFDRSAIREDYRN